MRFAYTRQQLISFAVFLGVFLFTSSVLADSGQPLKGLGDKLAELAGSLIQSVGYGATLLGGAWAVLAWMGRLGYFSAAIGIFVGGIFLSQLESFVKFLF
jgi:hypothetical protein